MKFVPKCMMPDEPQVVLKSNDRQLSCRIEYPKFGPADYVDEYYYTDEDPEDYRDSE